MTIHKKCDICCAKSLKENIKEVKIDIEFKDKQFGKIFSLCEKCEKVVLEKMNKAGIKIFYQIMSKNGKDKR